MKNLLLISTITLLFFSCSKDDSDEPFPIEDLATKIEGVWRQSKATFVQADGTTDVQSEGCSLKNEVGFSKNGTYVADDYEGADINDCSYFQFNGSWRAEVNPNNSDTNIKIRNGDDRDWNYAKITFEEGKLIITYKTTSRTSIYEHNRVQ